MAALLAVLALITLPACDFLDQLRDPESDPQTFEVLSTDEFYGSGSEIAGGGASPFVAYSRWDGYAHSVRLLRHDASRPDDLELLAELPASGALFVDGGVAVVSTAAGMTLVDLAGAELATATVPSPAFGPERVAVSGRWILAASERSLALLDRDAGEWVAVFTAPAPVTSALAAQGTFLAFTTTGYVHVTPDATAPTFAAVAHATLKGFRSAFADGAEAIVAGPSLALGRSRVVRLDLANATAPVVLRSHEVDVPFAFFAWDGGATSIVAGPLDSGGGRPAYLLREEGGAFTARGMPVPLWFDDQSFLAAHADRLFALSHSGFGFYRIRP